MQPVYNSYTADELQQQYSARSAVPEHPEIFERWRADSAAWRDHEAPAPWIDLAYGERPRQRLDLFHPDGTSPAPLHVFFHGGYWQSMARDDFSFVARGLNARGIAVAVVGYSLCPDVSLTTIVDEARSAIAWLHARRWELHLDSGRLQISGHSAGGHLAAMLAATPPAARGGVTIDWIAPVSGVFELEPLVHTALNEALQLDPPTARELSPLAAEPVGSIAVDAWVGALESAEFHRQSAEFVNQWQLAGATTGLHQAGHCHHFSVLDALYASGGELVKHAVARAHT
ncbi:MAG: alpha/beta hydrolase [Halofilum sp. (in: g-proteobacteria)]